MNRRTKIYIFAVISAAIILQIFINNSVNREKKMVEQVMSDELSTVCEGNVSAYAFYGNEELKPSVKELMVRKLARRIGVYTDYSISHKNDGYNETTILKKAGAYGDTEIRLITMGSEDTMGNITYENYFMSNITLHESSTKEIYHCKKLLLNIYEQLGMEPVTNIYVGSSIKGKLSSDEINNEIKTFLDTMDAREVETINIDGVYCTYGYSRNIDTYAYQNGEKVNVNIAISYDEDTDITYIHKAIPFIDKSF